MILPPTFVLDKPPPTPEAWIDALADNVEIDRLLKMEVLQRADECSEVVSGTLTTRFVYGAGGSKRQQKEQRNG